MAEQSGQSIDALQSRLDALSARQTELNATDARLADAMTAAHAVAVGALASLDRIEEEIESVVAAPEAFARDTRAGAHEIQHFLLAKHREIITVVRAARATAEAKAAVVQELLGSYRSSDTAPRR